MSTRGVTSCICDLFLRYGTQTVASKVLTNNLPCFATILIFYQQLKNHNERSTHRDNNEARNKRNLPRNAQKFHYVSAPLGR